MTNNPTIHGVSRELLESFAAYVADSPNAVMRSRGVQLRALLDADHTEKPLAVVAPAVERQEPALLGYRIETEHGHHFKDSPTRGMGINCIELADRSEVAALQSTIAQLQARVAELESGRGEPVAWANGEQLKLCAASPREVQPNNPMLHNLPRNIAGSALPTEYCNTPLYTAPPAPVAAQDPDIIHDAAFRNGVMHGYSLGTEGSEEDYQKCISRLTDSLNAARRERRLDATAALNGDKP